MYNLRFWSDDYKSTFEVSTGICDQSLKCRSSSIQQSQYIQLHEFEALVFAGLDKLKAQYAPAPKLDKAILKLENALEQHNGNPEEVNDSTATAPSKRIIVAFTGLYNYNKKMTGPDVAKATGINNLKDKCAHFAQWLGKLEAFKNNLVISPNLLRPYCLSHQPLCLHSTFFDNQSGH